MSRFGRQFRLRHNHATDADLREVMIVKLLTIALTVIFTGCESNVSVKTFRNAGTSNSATLNVVSAIVTTTQITLSWSEVASANSYEVKIASDTVCNSALVKTSSSTTSAVIDINLNGKTAYACIAALDSKSSAIPGAVVQGYELVPVATSSVADPTADIPAGAYGPSQTITLASATTGATVHYAINGTPPTCSSPTGSVSVNTSMTIKAIACKKNYKSSAVVSFEYVINGAVAPPTFNVDSGTYYATQNVILNTSTSGATIRYTTDGSNPNSSSPVYTSAINVSSNMTIKAIATKLDYSDSSIASAIYTLNTITPVSVEAFPDTTNYPAITWTPNAKFNISSSDTVGLYSDQVGTLINIPTTATAGSNMFTASPVSTLGQTNTIYAKAPTQQNFVNLGTYTTKLPLGTRSPGVTGSGGVSALVKDKVSPGCTVAPHCVIVGGLFRSVGKRIVNSILRIRVDGSIEALGSGFDDQVTSIAIDSSGNIYAGGLFSCAGGSTQSGDWPNIACSGSGGATNYNRIAKWNGSAWLPLGSGFDDTVHSLAVDSFGNLYAGGYLTCAGGSQRSGSYGSFSCSGSGGSAVYNSIAKWNGTTWTSISSGTTFYDVSVMTIDSANNLYATGSEVTGTGYRVVKWNGSSWSSVGASFSGHVFALAIDNSGILHASGLFQCASGSLSTGSYPNNTCSGSGGTTVYNGIAKWNGSTWLPLDKGFDKYDGIVAGSIAFDSNGNLYAGGTFNKAGGNPANKIAKWNGSAWSAVGSGITGDSKFIMSLLFDGSGNLYAGGYFETMDGVTVNGIAKLTGSTWSSGISGSSITRVSNMSTDNSGNIFVVRNVPANVGIAGGVSTLTGSNWQSIGAGFSNVARVIVVDSPTNLYVGGHFVCAEGSISSGTYPANSCSGTGGSSTFNRIAKWNGSSWSSLGSGVDNIVTALKLDSSGNLYVGGSFTQAGGLSANSIAKWSGTAWSALGSGFNSNVSAIALDGAGNLYAAGSFKCAGGSTAAGSYPNVTCSGSGGATVYNGIAKWSGSVWSPLGSGIDGSVTSLAVDSTGNLYAGGTFTTAGGIAANNIAKWNGSAWSALGSGLTYSDGTISVRSLAIDNSRNIYAGGLFTSAGDTPVNSVAMWNGSTWSPLGMGVTLEGASGDIYALAFDPLGNLIAAGNFDSADTLERGILAKWIPTFGAWF